MPQNVVIDQVEVERIEAGTSGNKEYKRQVERILKHFSTYLTDTEKEERSIEDVYAESSEVCEGLVKRFFYSLRIDEVEVDKKTGKKSKTGRQIPPKLGYAKNIKCTLFKSLTSLYKVLWF